MANTTSAKKATRKIARKTAINKSRRTHMRGQLRKMEEAIQAGDKDVLIDDHGSEVCDEVWALYGQYVGHYGPVPTLVEWDSDIPALPVLVAEVTKARRLVEANSSVGSGG